MTRLRRGDRVRVLSPPDLRDREGSIALPVWTPAEGERRIGVRLDSGELEWVTAVEVLGSRRVSAQ